MSSLSRHFKRKLRMISGGALGKGPDTSKGHEEFGAQQARNQELAAAEADYGNIEKNTRDTYLNAAKKAGTYSNTAEFNSGFNSEVQAGVRGARAEAVRRINALRKAAGNNEEFKPEGYDQTQGNVTADKLANAPVQEDSPTVAAPDEDAGKETQGPMPGNAAAGVQNVATAAAKARLLALQKRA